MFKKNKIDFLIGLIVGFRPEISFPPNSRMKKVLNSVWWSFCFSDWTTTAVRREQDKHGTALEKNMWGEKQAEESKRELLWSLCNQASDSSGMDTHSCTLSLLWTEYQRMLSKPAIVWSCALFLHLGYDNEIKPYIFYCGLLRASGLSDTSMSATGWISAFTQLKKQE